MAYENSIDTEYFVITLDSDGRGYHVRLHDSIKSNPHHRELTRYVKKLIDDGVTRFNADHIGFSGRDKSLQLDRGKRRIDLMYIQDGITYECELKTPYECGLNRTWEQVKEQARHCNRLTMLVARSEVRNVEEIITMLKLDNVFVESYD